MKKIKYYTNAFFVSLFWKIEHTGTEISVNGSHMLWHFYFIPRRTVIYICLFIFAIPILILFGVVGYVCVCRDYLEPQKTSLYYIRKPVGETPSAIEFLNQF